MMKKAKKMEAKKQKELSKKREEKDKKMTQAIQMWETDIFPKWHLRFHDKRTITLWDQGIPPRCRKKAWKLKIGNELNVTKTTFTDCLRRIPISSMRKTRRNKQPLPDAYTDINDSSFYKPRKRTSSLDVLREKKDDERSFESVDDVKYDESSQDEESTEDSESGGRPAMELNAQFDDVDDHNIQVYDEDDDDDDDDDNDDDMDENDTDSFLLDDDTTNDDDDENRLVVNPTVINFLNKAIDEDILRTLPSLCVFQVP